MSISKLYIIKYPLIIAIIGLMGWNLYKQDVLLSRYEGIIHQLSTKIVDLEDEVEYHKTRYLESTCLPIIEEEQ